MPTYRMNGIKFDRANIAGVDSDVKAGLLKYIAARERDLNTIETSHSIYTSGPFAGQMVELCIDGAGMLPLNFKGWIGNYSAGKWEGTTGEPLAVVADVGMLAKTKDAGAMSKGYAALGDLLSQLAEDPSDHEQETTIRQSIYVSSGVVDDFGDQIKDPAPIGIYRVAPSYYAGIKIPFSTWGENPTERGAPYAVDDFGSLFALSPVLVRPIHTIDFDRRVIRAVYTIGRTTYKINATAQSVDALRAKILAKKRFFADKLQQAAPKAKTPEQETQDTEQAAWVNRQAAQDVAQVVALATAAAAIEQASEASQTQDIAQQAHEDGREMATVCEASNEQAQGASQGRARSHAGSSTTISQAARSTQPAGQAIASKSGKWRAIFKTAPDGLPMMEFSDKPNDWKVCHFDTGRERMAALQAMAQRADRQDVSTGSDSPPTQGATTPTSARPQSTPATDYTDSRDTSPDNTRRAPRAFTEQSTEFVLRGIAWRVTVARYWVIDAVEESREPDLLCWRAFKKGGRFGGADFVRVAAEKMPRDAVNRAHAFFVQVQALDAAGQASTPAPGATATPTPSTPAAADTPSPAAATGPDYTEGRETSTPDYTTARETSPGALSITITRIEGPVDQCGRPVTVDSFADADFLLHTWSVDAPKDGCYDKCKFIITWPAGHIYSGRYDLKHHSAERPSLTAHMVDLAEFYIGKNCPAHLSAAQYAQRMEEVSEDTRSDYAEILSTMAGLGAYFAKARPVALDLRALLAQGMAPADFVGLGVTYCGDQANPSGMGAIVSAEADQRAGVRLAVILEDGRQLNPSAVNFGDKAGDRYRLDMKRHGAPYLAQLAAAVATSKASSSAAKAQTAQTHAQALADLAAQYPQLKRAENRYAGGKLAAVNTRVLLKENFKGVKFSVTSDHNSVRVNWTDGPTGAQVDQIISRFDIGASDSQTDYFYTVSTAFSDLFGGCQYLSTSRHTSDALILRALEEYYPDASTRPSVEDWRHGRGVFDWSLRDGAQRLFREHLSATPGA